MVDEGKQLLEDRLSPDGYNVGPTAGQTVMHCHIHLISPRLGDSVNPRGAVRGVVTGKADMLEADKKTGEIRLLEILTGIPGSCTA